MLAECQYQFNLGREAKMTIGSDVLDDPSTSNARFGSVCRSSVSTPALVCEESCMRMPSTDSAHDTAPCTGTGMTVVLCEEN